MSASRLMDVITEKEPEFVVAVVAPVGVDLGHFETQFTNLVGQYHYSVNPLRLSTLAVQRFSPDQWGVQLDESSNFRRYASLMSIGTEIRKRARRGDVLALQAITEIARSRPVLNGTSTPIARRVHFIRSLKHPDEVEALRRAYGPGFFLIGVHSDITERLAYLHVEIGMEMDEARELLKRDEQEDDEAATTKLGQRTRDTFAECDVFIGQNDLEGIDRFLRLVFDHPFTTPTQAEYAMFLAHAAAQRSAQAGRQVGAVVMSSDEEVIATGTNEVPCFGGGLYWPEDENDARDHVWERDSNTHAIDQLIAKVADVVESHVAVPDREAMIADLRGRTGLKDLTEFGRVVHAEMEALLACARVGSSPVGGTLYTTTFPCHNCAKHIVAAGIAKVVYVEPYPKSRALEHHKDSVGTDAKDDTRVGFVPFVGVAARRYLDFFSMTLGSGKKIERKHDGQLRLNWSKDTATPRLRMSPHGYLERERRLVQLLEDARIPMMEQQRKAPTEVGEVATVPETPPTPNATVDRGSKPSRRRRGRR